MRIVWLRYALINRAGESYGACRATERFERRPTALAIGFEPETADAIVKRDRDGALRFACGLLRRAVGHHSRATAFVSSQAANRICVPTATERTHRLLGVAEDLTSASGSSTELRQAQKMEAVAMLTARRCRHIQHLLSRHNRHLDPLQEEVAGNPAP